MMGAKEAVRATSAQNYHVLKNHGEEQIPSVCCDPSFTHEPRTLNFLLCCARLCVCRLLRAQTKKTASGEIQTALMNRRRRCTPALIRRAGKTSLQRGADHKNNCRLTTPHWLRGAQQFPYFFIPRHVTRRQIGKGAAGHLCSRAEMIQQKGSALLFEFAATFVGGLCTHASQNVGFCYGATAKRLIFLQTPNNRCKKRIQP